MVQVAVAMSDDEEGWLCVVGECVACFWACFGGGLTEGRAITISDKPQKIVKNPTWRPWPRGRQSC